MTNRVNGVWVAFEHDVREDDVADVIAAIKQLRNVLAVEKHIADPTMSWIVEQRVRRALAEKLHDVLYPKPAGERSR